MFPKQHTSEFQRTMDSPMMQGGLEVNYQDHDDEEAEYAREELQRQNELHALLTDALDADDLLDDDDDDDDEDYGSTRKSVSNSSYDHSNGGDFGSEHSWPLDIAPAQFAGMNAVQTSTPRNADSMPPPLKTPATDYNNLYFQAADDRQQYWQYQRTEGDEENDEREAQPNQFTAQPNGWPVAVDEQHHAADDTVRVADSVRDEQDDGQYLYGDNHGQGQFAAEGHDADMQLRYTQAYDGPPAMCRGQVITDSDLVSAAHGHRVQTTQQHQNAHLHHHQLLPEQQMYALEQQDVTEAGQFQTDVDGNFYADNLHVQYLYADEHGDVNVGGEQQWPTPATFTQVPSHEPQSAGAPVAFSNNLLSTWPRTHTLAAQSKSPNKVSRKHVDEFGGYRVQYKLSEREESAMGDGYHAEQTRSQTDAVKTVPEKLQHDFLHTDEATTWSEREAQMRVLLDAKGHKIEELQRAVGDLHEASEREVRIMKHQLLMITDERDGLTQSLHQSEQLIQDKQAAVSQLNGQTAALQCEIVSLKQNKDDLIKKMMTLESMVESLNAELAELSSSDALTRAKQQHESVVASIRQKFDADTSAANEKIDLLTQKLTEKEELMNGLKKQVAVLEKANKSQLQENAEEINRLHRSLKQSQQECRELLEAHGSMELSRMKMKLQDALASKTLVDDVNASLQSEIQELKEHVRMYEVASQCSAVLTVDKSSVLNSASAKLDDSYTQLAIKKSSATTTSSRSGDSGLVSADEAMHGLKMELERCLKKVQDKTQQISKLQAELKTCRATIAENSVTLELAQTELKECKNMAETEKTGKEDAKQLQLQLDKLTSENAALKQELQEIHCRLSEAADSEARVTDLNIDLNQQIAELQQQKSNQNKDTGDMQQADECLLLQQQLALHQEEMAKLQAQLTATKELYVGVCKTKDELKEEVQLLRTESTRAKDCHQQTLTAQQEQFKDEISKQIRRLGEEYDAKVLAASQELSGKLAAAVTEKEQLQLHINTAEEQLKIRQQQQQTLAAVQQEHAATLSELKMHHEQQLSELEMQHAEVKRQRELEVVELNKVNDQMNKLQHEMSAQLDELKAKNAALESELNVQRKTPTSVANTHDVEQMKLTTEMSHIAEQLMAAEDRLQKLEFEKLAMTAANRELTDSLESKVAVLEGQLADTDTRCQQLLTTEHDSMQREHALVVAALHEKLAEKHENVSTQVVNGSQVSLVDAERLKQLTAELTGDCVTVMEKMKAAMLGYVGDATRINAAEYQNRLVRDRHATARNLRSYYLKCLGKLLDADFDHVYKAQFLKRMGRLLDNLPEKEDISASSQCTTPSVQSTSTTPRPADSADSTPRNLPPRSRPAKPKDVPSLALGSDSDGSNSVTSENATRELRCSVAPSTNTVSRLHTSEHSHDSSSRSPMSRSSGALNESVPTCRSQLYHASSIGQESVRQLPHSRGSVTDVLSSCITTTSSTGRGGLTSSSSYDHSSRRPPSADGSRPSSASGSHSQSHGSSRPAVSHDRPPTTCPTTRSSAAYTADWITTRN